MTGPQFIVQTKVVDSIPSWDKIAITVPDVGVITKVRGYLSSEVEGVTLDCIISKSSTSYGLPHKILSYTGVDLVEDTLYSEESEYYEINPDYLSGLEEPIGTTRSGKPVYLITWNSPSDFSNFYRTYSNSEHNDAIKLIDARIKEKRAEIAVLLSNGNYASARSEQDTLANYIETKQRHRKGVSATSSTRADSSLYIWYKTSEMAEVEIEVEIEVNPDNDFWYSRSKTVSSYKTYPPQSSSSTTVTTGILDWVNLTDEIDGETSTFESEVVLPAGSKIILTLNGQVLAEGAEYDYTLTLDEGGLTIQLVIAPESGDVLGFYYIKTE